MLDFLSWAVYAATGRVLIYVWFLFPLPPKAPAWLQKLHSCDLCAGTWIYSILAIGIGADLFGLNNAITQVATGIVTSLLIHIFVIGLKEKFSPTIVIS